MMEFDPVSYLLGAASGGGARSKFLGDMYLVQGYETPEGIRMGTLDSTNVTYFIPIDGSGSIVKLDTSQPFEFGITIRFSDFDTVAALCGQFGSTSWGTGNRAPSIVVSGANYVAFALPGASTWESVINPIPEGYSLPTDTDIFFKAEYDGEKWKAYINDGTEEMTAEAAVNTPYYSSANYMVFANQGMSSYPPRAGIYKLRGLYMKQNGVLIWGRE